MLTPLAQNNGSSWADAYNYLQDALATAVSGDQIWVAEGIYWPTGPSSSRTATFQLKNGVAVYGGFTGTETSLNQRDWKANETILSGDLDGSSHVDFDDLKEFVGYWLAYCPAGRQLK